MDNWHMVAETDERGAPELNMAMVALWLLWETHP